MIQFREEIRFFLSLLKLTEPRPWALAAVALIGTLASLAEGIGITFFIPFFSIFSGFGSSDGAHGWIIGVLNSAFKDLPAQHRLMAICGTILACVLLKVALTFGNRVICSWQGTGVTLRLRGELFERLLFSSSGYIETAEHGKLFHALDSQPWYIGEALVEAVNVVILLCTLIVFFSLVVLISWYLALFALTGILLASWASGFIRKRVIRLGGQHSKAWNEMSERIWEGLSGMRDIRAFGRERHELDRFVSAAFRVRRRAWREFIMRSTALPFKEMLVTLMLIAMLLVTGLWNPENLGPVLVAVLLLYRLQPTYLSFEGSRMELNSLRPYATEFLALLHGNITTAPTSGSKTFAALEKGIHFKNVSFQYNTQTAPALSDISFSVPSRKLTALVGPSGSGKSTVVDLILRFIDPVSGSIRADESDLRDLDLVSWRNRVALVSQDPYLFNSTVAENIAYGKLDATIAEIKDAAVQAHADSFISEFHEGYQTRVGSRGVLLSAGQRQRLALARAIIHNPDILILDEATNALDSISEDAITQTLLELRKTKTLIIVAHRMATVQSADQLVVLNSGRIEEQGSFEELMAADGLFARMCRLQHLAPSAL